MRLVVELKYCSQSRDQNHWKKHSFDASDGLLVAFVHHHFSLLKRTVGPQRVRTQNHHQWIGISKGSFSHFAHRKLYSKKSFIDNPRCRPLHYSSTLQTWGKNTKWMRFTLSKTNLSPPHYHKVKRQLREKQVMNLTLAKSWSHRMIGDPSSQPLLLRAVPTIPSSNRSE